MRYNAKSAQIEVSWTRSSILLHLHHFIRELLPGRVAERLIASLLKSEKPERVSKVRILPLPPSSVTRTKGIYVEIQQYSINTVAGPIPLLLLPIPGRATTSVRIIIDSGSVDERESEYGIAHFLEHMAFKGSEKYTCEQINRELASVGDPNAYTSGDRTVYYIDTIPQFIKKAAEFLAEMVFHSTLPVEELEKERGVILQEWQASEDSAGGFYFGTAAPTVFGPKGHQTLGTDKHIKAHTREAIQAFKQRTYALDRITFAVVGNIPDSSIQKTVDELTDVFSKEGVGFSTELETIPTRVFIQPGADTEIKHISTQAWLGLWWPWFDLAETHSKDYSTLIFDNILGDGLHSLLTTELREKQGLCYSSGCFAHGFQNNPAFITYCLLKKDKIVAAKAAMLDVLSKIRDTGIDPELMAISKANFLIKGTQSFDGRSKYSTVVDCWRERFPVMGNRIRTMEDVELCVSKFTQETAKDLADYMLKTPYHTITMTEKSGIDSTI